MKYLRQCRVRLGRNHQSNRGRGSAMALLPGLGLFLATFHAQAVTFPLTWNWANPTPHGNNIIDIAYNNQVWVQVAERGQMYTSTDLALWTPVDTHTTKALRSVTFFNDKIIVSAESGTMLSGTSPTTLQLIDLGTTDWLEGVAASTKLAVAVGDNGAIYTSADATNWKRQTVSFTEWLRSVAYGPPGANGTFVAVGQAGFVATSQDGSHWQAQSRITSSDLNRVEWFSGEFWTVGNSGAAFQSTAGTRWTAASSGATNILNAFAGLDSKRLLGGETEVRLRSKATASWVNELDPVKTYPPPAWTYLCATTTTNIATTTNSTNFASAFVLCGRSGMMVEGLISTNGATNVWFGLSDSLWNWLWDVKHFPNLYLAVGDRSTIMSSPDGYAWDAELPPDSTTNSIFLGIGGKTNLAVAVGSAGTIINSPDTPQQITTTNTDGTITTNFISAMGIYWQAVQPRPTTEDLQGISVFGDQLIVTGGAGTILTSTDGATWTKRTSPTTAFLSSVEAFPNGVIAVGKQGTILTSSDAVSWNKLNPQTTNWIYRVRYLGDRLIAVGENGVILTSSDGSNWTPQNSGTTAWLNDVLLLDGTYFAIGNQGTVLSSLDAVTWTDRGTITGKSLFSAATGDGMLVVVGIEGVILRSQIVPIDPAITFLQFPIRPDQNGFIFSGRSGVQFTLDRSPDLRSWDPSPLLRIDSSGKLPYNDPRSNSPAEQFFRTTPKP